MDHLLERFAERSMQSGVCGQTLHKVGLPWEEMLQEAEDYDLTLLGKHTYFQLYTQEFPDPTFDLAFLISTDGSPAFWRRWAGQGLLQTS